MPMLPIARGAERVVAIDISDEVARTREKPGNCRPVLSDGTSIAAPAGPISLACSNQPMAQLHPDDALQRPNNIGLALQPGGRHIRITPSRVAGPHGISRHFCDRAEGVHLRECAHGDLDALMRQVGFRSVEAFMLLRGRAMRVPIALMRSAEGLVGRLPAGLRRRPSRFRLASGFSGINLAARK